MRFTSSTLVAIASAVTVAVLCAVRLLLTSVVILKRYQLMERLGLPEDNPRVKKITNVRNGLEACAIVW